jgi:outer membrane protein TolC
MDLSLKWAILAVFLLSVAQGAGASSSLPAMSLEESIALALKQSVMIHAVREGVKGAQAQQDEAFTAFLPKFSTSYSYTRLNSEPTFTFPGARFTVAPGVTGAIPAMTLPAGTRDNHNWSVELRQPVFAGGGIRANYETGRLGTDVARWEEAAAVQDLILEVKTAYFNILKAGRMLVVARQSLDRLTAHRDTAQAFFDEGLIPKNDLLFAEVEMANGQQFLLKAENGLAMAKAKFNTVLRREIDALVEIRDILDEAPFDKTLEACIAEALQNRPEIRSQALRLEQARQLVAVARSEYYPNVGLVGNYARFGDTAALDGTTFKDRENWYVMAVANWNFWEWGKTKNRVDAGLSRENQSADLLANLRDQITLEVKNAFLLLHEAGKQLQVSKKAIEQAQENFRINTERYREQVGRSTDVIDAQTLLTRTRSDYDTALGDYNISRARMERAMGRSGF